MRTQNTQKKKISFDINLNNHAQNKIGTTFTRNVLECDDENERDGNRDGIIIQGDGLGNLATDSG